jgi:hypothetical protein
MRGGDGKQAHRSTERLFKQKMKHISLKKVNLFESRGTKPTGPGMKDGWAAGDNEVGKEN